MLKTIMSSQVFVTNKVLIIDEVGGIEGDDESIKKCGKSSKTRKLFKFQKSTKLKKKLSKSGNLPNFNAKKNEPSFLISNAKMAFNYLWLAFTKAPIL